MRAYILVLATIALVLALTSAPARAGSIDCTMNFSLSGWSLFYKTSSGIGTVKCNNGKSMKVKISAKGGGFTFGKTKIANGIGKFSEVDEIGDVIGSYGNAEAHAGAGKSASAQVVTKGKISLALSGKGEGWNLGVSFGKFTLSRP